MDLLTNISLFSGVGGLDLAAKWTGKIKTVAYCEYDTYAQAVLQSRIRDGQLDDAPIWDDVSTFEGEPWKGVDIVSGGFPCQDVSVAGKKAGVEEGTRSGLFYQITRLCREVGPRFVLLENVAGLLVFPGAHRVFGELANLGYNAGWKVISASTYGAYHDRKRIFILAYPRGIRFDSLDKEQEVISTGVNIQNLNAWGTRPDNLLLPVERVITEPSSGYKRVDDGLAEGMDRLRCCGNGVVPQQAALAWNEIIRLSEMWEKTA